MSDLFGNPEDRFSRVAAHIIVGYEGVYIIWTRYHDDVCVCQIWTSKRVSLVS